MYVDGKARCKCKQTSINHEHNCRKHCKQLHRLCLTKHTTATSGIHVLLMTYYWHTSGILLMWCNKYRQNKTRYNTIMERTYVFGTPFFHGGNKAMLRTGTEPRCLKFGQVLTERARSPILVVQGPEDLKLKPFEQELILGSAENERNVRCCAFAQVQHYGRIQ